MAVPTTTFTPIQIWAGEKSDERRSVTVKMGQNLAAYTVVMSDAAGKIVIHDGAYANKVAGILIAAVDATSADAAGMVYKNGDFMMDVIVWPATIGGGAPTTLLKQKLLEGIEIYATPYVAGEL
jgi:uncharacterized protein (DUF1786 family)